MAQPLKLWLLRPAEGLDPHNEATNPWEPWFDKAFGFVVRAETEQEARQYADAGAGDENHYYAHYDVGGYSERHPWLDPDLSTCVELTPSGESGIVIRDFSRA